MSFFHKFSQWNKLDQKTQRENPTEMNFPMVNCETRKKNYLDIHYFFNKRLTVAFATKYRFK